MKNIASAIESSSLELESERLRFRPISLRDVDGIYALRSNPKAMAYMDSYRHQSIEDSRSFILKNLEVARRREGVFWAIMEKESSLMIGDFVFYDIDSQNYRASIGYMLLPEHWGKGYMPEGLRLLLQFGFQQLGIHSFSANINPNNNGSRKVLEKVGFRKEGYFRESYHFDGQFYDSEIYCILQQDLQ